jgi:hypothetical protein
VFDEEAALEVDDPDPEAEVDPDDFVPEEEVDCELVAVPVVDVPDFVETESDETSLEELASPESVA